MWASSSSSISLTSLSFSQYWPLVGEAIEDFDLRSSGNTRLHRTEQRDAVVQREHTFFFDFLLVLAGVGAGGRRRTCSVGLAWSVGVKLANRQGLDGDGHDLIACCRHDGRRAREARPELRRRIVQSDDNFEIFCLLAGAGGSRGGCTAASGQS